MRDFAPHELRLHRVDARRTAGSRRHRQFPCRAFAMRAGAAVVRVPSARRRPRGSHVAAGESQLTVIGLGVLAARQAEVVGMRRIVWQRQTFGGRSSLISQSVAVFHDVASLTAAAVLRASCWRSR